MEYRYGIGQFFWNKELNTFFANAWSLDCELPDGSIHQEAFPNNKEQFYIVNPKTGGFRRFRFVKKIIDNYKQKDDFDSEENEIDFEIESWLFESEDGIQCKICIS